MASKIFISYKYYDTSVYQDYSLDFIPEPNTNPISIYSKRNAFVTPRSYVNKLSEVLDGYAIEKWEQDGEDLSCFKDSTIASRLRDKIYDSTITIVLVSPKMKEPYEYERDQWIPWEISYSLKEITRNDRTSKTNAVIAIVLPDLQNSYEYCIEKNPGCDSYTLHFDNEQYFKILGKNFFNSKYPDKRHCSICDRDHYYGDKNHYFVYARWCDFMENPAEYIDTALEHLANIEDYELCKEV